MFEELEAKEQKLREKNQELNKIEQDLLDFESLLQKKTSELEHLRETLRNCNDKLVRSKRLIDLLAEENSRWSQDIDQFKQSGQFIEGNSALAATMICYTGSFTFDLRAKIQRELIRHLKELQIPIKEDSNFLGFMGNEILFQKWNINQLPKDDCSLENGIMIQYSERWVYAIDPQKQAHKFLSNQAKQHPYGFEIVKANNPNLLRIVEQCIVNGKFLVVDDCTETPDILLEPILQKKVLRNAGVAMILIGEKTLNYHEEFQLFLLTNLSNPRLTPETCSKVNVINFGITQQGLVEQMLATIVILENRKLEDQKNLIVKKNATDKNILYNLENQILKTLSDSDQNQFLETSDLIDQLIESKKTSH